MTDEHRVEHDYAQHNLILSQLENEIDAGTSITFDNNPGHGLDSVLLVDEAGNPTTKTLREIVNSFLIFSSKQDAMFFLEQPDPIY